MEYKDIPQPLKNKAFTIVELLVVIVVISILAIITLISYNNISAKAVEASLVSDLENASKLLKMDQISNINYPVSLSLANDGRGLTPSQGTTYQYVYNNSSNPRTFCLTATKNSTSYRVTNDNQPVAGSCQTSGIITDGLVLSLDAGNPVSYPGTGTTWADMGGLNKNATLVNGVTYSTNDSGSLIYDGSNDYADVVAANLTTTASVELWANLGAAYSGRMIFGWHTYDIWCNGGGIGYNTGNSDQYGITGAAFTSLGVVNNWKQYIFEMRSDVPYTNNKIYVNKVPQALSQINATENPVSRHFNSGLGRVASWRNSLNYFMPMKLGSVRIYNRSLSDTKIQQNFDAVKGRYGL